MFTKLNSLSGSIPLFSPDSQSYNSDPYKLYDDELKTAQKKLDKIDHTISQQPSFFQSNKNTLLLIGFMALATVLLSVGLFTPYGPQDFTAFSSLAGQKGGAIAFENAKLASGFVTAGFALPIVIGTIGCLSLLSSYFSHKSKIKKNNEIRSKAESHLEEINKNRTQTLENMIENSKKLQEFNIQREEIEMNEKIREASRVRPRTRPGAPDGSRLGGQGMGGGGRGID